jgi:hypothetical protein
MTTVHIFIPRILNNISEDFVRQTFYEMNIGIITYIDMHYRVNEMNYRYAFAFINIQLFDSEIAKNISYKLSEYGRAHVPYDDRNYWEIKHHIPKEKRGYVEVQAYQPITEKALRIEEEQEKIIIATEEDEKDPEWLNDDCDDWKIDIIDCSPSFIEDSDVSNLCIELLKTPEERERERDFDDLQREINKTVFTNRVAAW